VIRRANSLSPNVDLVVTLSDTRPFIPALSAMNEKVQKKTARKAAYAAMQIVRKAAVANAKEIDNPDSPRAVWKNITVQNSPRQGRRVGGIVMRVGVKGGARQYAQTKSNVRKGRAGKTYRTLGDKGNPGGDTWYWRFVEFGTATRRAQPFLQRALAENAQEVTDATARALTVALIDSRAPT
jgi:HK97 gp10 family phage protein